VQPKSIISHKIPPYCFFLNSTTSPTWCWKPHNRMFIRLDNKPECDRRRDRQNPLAITAVCIV